MLKHTMNREKQEEHFISLIAIQQKTLITQYP